MEKKRGTYRLIPATNHYTKEMKQLVFDVLEEYGLKPGAIDFCLDDVEKHYFERGGYFVVILDQNGVVVGTGGIYPLDDQSLELRKMYLRSEHRGKGLGQWMLTLLLEKAKVLGFQRVELDTASVLKEAIGLYKKNGFQRFESDHMVARCDQAYELLL
ncbi:GNAT family N-acetyltransferase [Aureispira sp. CCB-QB1]|uniref:GNAT family N-acetyltransferase n=1 Tax=Aureispira sp. CCB-QB1 TaxID=1313421 RepID=UPI0009DF861F|nr:GNAT family N-acetyltransferase [Aureispira sp. CCB-QB1]